MDIKQEVTDHVTCHIFFWSMAMVSILNDVPAGFLLLIFDSDYYRLYSYSLEHGYSFDYTNFNNNHILLFHSYHQLHDSAMFCIYHSILMFSYELQIHYRH